MLVIFQYSGASSPNSSFGSNRLQWPIKFLKVCYYHYGTYVKHLTSGQEVLLKSRLDQLQPMLPEKEWAIIFSLPELIAKFY